MSVIGPVKSHYRERGKKSTIFCRPNFTHTLYLFHKHIPALQQ